MEQEYEVKFEARFKVKCKPEELADMIANFNIPGMDIEVKNIQINFGEN